MRRATVIVCYVNTAARCSFHANDATSFQSILYKFNQFNPFSQSIECVSECRVVEIAAIKSTKQPTCPKIVVTAVAIKRLFMKCTKRK